MQKETKLMMLCLGLFLVLTAVLCGCGSGSAKTTTSTPDPNSPQALIIGKWELSGSTIEFSKGGDTTVTQDGDTTKYKYTLTAVDGSPNSVKITLTDSSNSSTSETAVFKDKDTMVLGSSTFKRVTASTSATSNSSSSSGTSNGTTSSSSSKSTTASSSNASQSSSSSQATKNFNEPGYYATFKYPASMKVTPEKNNTIRLDSTTGNTYFIRCEQKFLQDSLSKGLTNEEATKSFLATMTNNLKNDSKNTITNLKVNSLAMNDGSAVSEAMLYCKVGGNKWKVRIQVTAMGGYILMTQIWSDDKGYNKAVKELQGIMDTLAIK